MPRAWDRRQLEVDRDPLKQLDTNYGKLPKLVNPLSVEGFRTAFANSLKLFLGIDLTDQRPFLTWLFDRPFFINLLHRIQAARLLAQQRIRAGTNLVSDPSIDNADFWQQYSTEQVDDTEVTPYAGDHALKITSLGHNPVRCFFNTDSDGEVDPIKTRRGDVFIVEAHVYAPVTNATGDVQLVGRVSNSRTGNYQDTVIDYVQMSGAYRGAWQKVSGTIEVPAGFDEFSAGLVLPEDETTAGNVFFGDQFIIREVTDTHRLFALSHLFARRGSNLLLDPNVEDPVFWSEQPQAEQVGTDVILPSSGSTALQITALGGENTDVYFNTAFNGLVEPITVRRHELFAVEARVLSPSTNSVGNISLIAKYENSRSGSSTTEVLDTAVFDAETQDAWQSMIGYARIPFGYNRLSMGIRLPAGQFGAGQHVFADELVMRETTAIRRLFDVLKLRSRRGGNLVTDPSIEDAEFWTQESCQQVGTDVVTPSSGDTALQVTSRGAQATDIYFNTGPDGSIESIHARRNEYYEVAARIYSPSGNTTGNVQLIALFENSRSGESTDVVITTKQFDSAARGSWQLVSGFVKVPAGFNRISLGMRLPANQTVAGQKYFADELLIHEATAAQRLAEILRLRIRRGSNLVTDPTFDDPEFWTQDSTSIVDYQTVIPTSGNQSLQITSRGGTATPVYFNTGPDGAVEPIKVRRGDTYEVAAYIYAPAANTNGVVNLTARVSNSRNGNTDDITITSFAFTSTYENTWTLVHGYVKIPLGYNQLSAGVLLGEGETTAGDVYFVNEAMIRESTGVKRLLDLSRNRVRHGVNLLSDANFEDSDLWVQDSVAQVGTVTVGSTTVEPRTGNHSLQLTSRGATATTVLFNTAYDGSIEPIRARVGEHYYLECYVLSPAANGPATVKLIARLANERTGNYEDHEVDTQSFDTLTENTWQQLKGYVRIPLGKNLISAGLTLDANASTAGDVFFVDDALLKEVTGSQRITDALFDGFNATTGSFGKNADDVLASMDGVKDGQRALELARKRAKVGPNFVNDPRIEDTSYWSGQTANVGRSETYARNGGSSLQVTCNATTPTYAYFNTIDGGTVQPLATWQDDALFVSCWYFAPAQPGGGTVDLVVKAINSATGAAIETVLKTVTVAEAGPWKRLSGLYTMPEGADGFSAGVKVSATGLTGSQTYKIYFDALVIREQSAAQRLFNIGKIRTRAGNNLVGDPNFDDAEFWTQDQAAQVDSTIVDPRTGSYSLQITSQGFDSTTVWFNTDADGVVQPIKTRFNERYYVEAYCLSPMGNSNATVKLIVRLENSKTGDSTDVVIDDFDFTTLTEGVWQKLSGYVRVTAGHNLISAGLYLPPGLSVAGNVIFVDDALIREVTNSQRLADVLFDGFNGTTGSLGRDADEVYNSMGFLGDGTKALSLARKRAAAGNNFVNDPHAEEFGYWTQPSTVRSADYNRNGQYSLKVTSRGATPTYCWWTTIDGGVVQPLATWEDDCIHAQCWVYAPVQSGSGSIKLVARASNSYTGAYVDTVLKTLAVPEDDWTKLSGIYTVPKGADTLTVGVLIDANFAPTGYQFYLDSLSIREATAVQRLSDISRLRSRRGSNLISDPGIDDAAFWQQPSVTQVGTSVITPYSGDYALKITSQGLTLVDVMFNTAEDGTVDPISSRPGEWFLVECFLFCPWTNSDGTITLIGRAHNSRTGATNDVTIENLTFNASNKGTWQRLSGYTKVPAGFNRISAGIRLESGKTTAGNIFYADDLMIRHASSGERLAENLSSRSNGATPIDDPDQKKLGEWVMSLVGRDNFHSSGSLVGTGQVGNVSPQLLANGSFDGATSMPADSPGGWSWDATVDHTATAGSGSAKCVANGTIRSLLSNDVDIFPTNKIDVSCWVLWSGRAGTGGLSLVLNVYDSAGTLLDSPILGTTASTLSGGWVQLSGSYTVPDLIAAKVPAKACVAFLIPETVTAGTFWVDDASLTKSNPLHHGLINGMQDAFDTLSDKRNAKIQDFVDALQSYDSKKTGTILDDFIPGVGLILENGIRGLRGLPKETDTYTHDQFLDAAVGQSNSATGNANEIQAIWQAINAGPYDEFERTATDLGANWSTWGSGNGALQTEGHNACLPDDWPNGTAEYAARWVGTNASSTSDYQQVSIVLASSPEKNLVYTGYNDVFGRMSGSTHSIRFRVGGDGSWSLSKFVSSVEYVMTHGNAGSINVPGPGSIITLYCGRKSTTTPLWFKVKINSTTICDLAEPTISGQPQSLYGSAYRGRGFGMRAEGLVFGANRRRPGLVNYWASSDQT